MQFTTCRQSFLSLLLILFFAGPSIAASFITGKVVQIKDGDTAVISPTEGGQFFVCRLYGIDAPETPKSGKPGQPYGEESAKELKHLILGQEVAIEIKDKDKYGREVCIIHKDSRDINQQMISKGAAWAYKKYLKSPYTAEYTAAENEAKGKKLGLWQQNTPEPPWVFRKR